MSLGLSALALGLALDAAIGDPVFPWHPVRLLGRGAAAAERLARRVFGCPWPPEAARHATSVARERAAGAVAWIIVTGCAGGTALLAWVLAAAAHPILGLAVGALLVWASIAPTDLAAHAERVRRALSAGDLAGARAAVSMIVGRDTSALDSPAVARAAIESVAESSIDGAAAPLFWAALLGPWAAFAYRAVNTMDSLFGHKNERYLHFGLAAARADDLANWPPARASSLLACLLAPAAGGRVGGALTAFWRWRLAHESPNAGHPEAAYAGALGLRLGGPSRYAEGVIDKPWINPEGKEASPEDLGRALRLMRLQTLASAAAFAALSAALSAALRAPLG